jgi:DNA-binding transcriptional ArsR family regulator
VLEQLITSRTRIKMLLKFFSNSNSTAYLRELADEFGESTNSIRLELNKLTKAGYLQSNADGRTIQYRANTEHKLFPEIKTIVYKYLGIDTIIEDIVNKVVARLGKLVACFIIGDYANGKDSGIIDMVFVGNVDQEYLRLCVERAESLIHRKIRTLVLSPSEFESNKEGLKVEKAILLWGEK